MMDYQQFTVELRDLFLNLLPRYIGTAHKRADTKVSMKPDQTELTDLDNGSLAELRALIGKHFPNDFTIGEEDKRNESQIQEILARRDQPQWTIDGLDGTWHFVRGTNSYGAMVARRMGDQILYAAIWRPVDMALRGNGFFYAEHENGAWEYCSDCRGCHRLRAAQRDKLERLTVLLEGSSKNFYKPPISSLGQKVTTRPSLSSCIAATTVARGDATAVITVGHEPWDAWPIILFVEQSGGIVTDWKGNHVTPENCGNIIAAANETDHGHLLGLLNQ